MPQPKRFTDDELRNRKNAKARESYLLNKEKRSAYHAALHKSRKDDPEYMQKLRDKASAYRAANPEKSKEQNARRRAKDPEKCRRESREWFAKNKDKRSAYQQNRKAKMLGNGGKLSSGIKEKLMALQKGKCSVCGADLNLCVVHKDHIVPLSLGGENIDSNIQLLCQPCNQTKHSKHPIDFMQSKGFLL